jgi:hypothetical protein
MNAWMAPLGNDPKKIRGQRDGVVNISHVVETRNVDAIIYYFLCIK